MNGKFQRGFTLVELMISLTIGLLILLVITQVYLSSFSTKKTQDDVSELTESSRFAFDLITREVRKAGFNNSWESPATGPKSKPFCSQQGETLTSAGASISGANDPTMLDPSTMSTSSGMTILNKSDALKVSFYGDNTNGTETSPLADCHGYPVAANQPVNEVLFVAADPANGGEPTLYCYTDNPTPVTATHPGSVPLVAGVESMQFLYGEDASPQPKIGLISRYLPWDSTNTVADYVLTVKASIVVRSPNAVTSDASSVGKVFKHFDNSGNYPAATNSDSGAVFTAPADRRVRQLVATEISLRNFCSQ